MPSPGSWLGLVGRRSECDALLELVAAARGRLQPGPGAARRAGDRQDRPAGLTWSTAASGCRVARAAGCRVGDGAGLRGAAPALRAVPGPAGRAARPAAARRCGTAFGLRAGAAAGPLPGRAGGAEPAGGGGRATNRWSAWSTTRSGWTRRRRRCWGSSPGGWRPSRWRWSSPRATADGDRSSPACRSWCVRGPADAGCRRRCWTSASRAARRAGPRPDRRRDPGQPAGAAGAAPRADRGGAGRRRSALPRRAAPLRRPDRAELPAPAATRCPAQTRQLLLLAAAEPLGDADAAVAGGRSGSGLGTDAAAPAEAAGLVEIGDRVRFRHPLVRSAVYRSAAAGGAPGRPPRAGRRHRPGPRPGPAGLAPRPGRGRARTRRWPPSSSARPPGPRPAVGWPRRPPSWSGRPR